MTSLKTSEPGSPEYRVLQLSRNWIRNQRHHSRLQKWAGFEYDFSGSVRSPHWKGYKCMAHDGAIYIRLWRM
ncbi:hypothetical protein [Larsenimonas suaedae]|uniref:Uncharacterized protein n=1 Tax=Larsenimonas suaedae TaxID=1851019 RepID=A0ABU1GZ22_9GAMM|nr:hypothetical protein [Larsenimonas suaedae]MCM2973772.1 hypothetical protein [Larsenimonas suaedae]MDR5897296.1 hypothetical protein [Larsenimonas suaedae]